MDKKVFNVHWRVSGEFDTLMVARYRWWRFEVHWPNYDKMGRIVSYPVKVYHRNQLKSTWTLKSIAQCTDWIMETCKDLALPEAYRVKTS